MFHFLKRPLRLRPRNAETGRFYGLFLSFARLQTHSSLRPVHMPASGHPDIGQRKQRDELCGVLGKPPVAHFEVTELALDNPKRMLHLGPHAGFELFGLFVQRAPGRVLLGNPPDRPKVPEVEFSTKEFLREEVKIYRQPDHGCAQTG